jgi:peptidyl-prolyl cis-trans isomerase SurA
MNRCTLRRSLTVAALLSLGLKVGVSAAQDPSELVDRIVAIVGDTVLLRSELQEFLFQLQARGAQVPEDPEQLNEFMRQALDQKVNEVLVVIHAQREGITITDSQVEEAVDEQLAQIRRRFSSESDFQQALLSRGITPAEFRIQLSEQAHAELLKQRYLQQKASEMPPLPVSEDEIRALFEAQRQALGPRPATISLKQVVIPTRPSPDSALVARERAEQALSRARAGEDFAQLAREYSDDIATRENGGELGWIQPGQLLPKFEEALFSMLPGSISDIVETAIGYHVIKLERVRGSQRLARHILMMPGYIDEDGERASQLAEEVAAALRSGSDVDSLINQYGDPEERSSLTDFPRDRLPQDYRDAIEGAQEGDVIDPFRLEVPGLPGVGKWVVAKLIEVSAGGEWTLDDVREHFRLQIQQDKTIQKIVDDLREATFIDVRLESGSVTG